jgi:hypothetical protein
MKNVTISMDDDLYQETRVKAAKSGLSISRYMARAAGNMNSKIDTDEIEVKRNRQLEALERILAGPKWDVTENGRMPTADERNARG